MTARDAKPEAVMNGHTFKDCDLLGELRP